MNLRQYIQLLSPRRRFNRDVLWNVASLGVLALAGGLMNLVIAAWAGADALGVFNQVYAIYIMLSQVAVGGLHYSALRSVSHNVDNLRRCTDIASSALLLSAVSAGAVCAATWLLRHWAGRVLGSPGVVVGLALATPGLLFFSLNKVLLNVLNGLRCMRAYAVFQALRFVFLVLAVVVILLSGRPNAYLAFSLTASEVVLFVLLAGYTHWGPLPLALSAGLRGWFGEHLSFGLRGFFSGFLSEMNTRVDVLMLGYFRGDAVVGVYSFAAILAEGLCQLPVVIRRNVDPVLGRCFAEQDQAKMRYAIDRVKKTTFVLMAAVAVATVAAYPLALRILLPDPSFAASWGVFAILMAGIVLNSAYRPFLGILLQGGRPGMNTVLVAGVVGGNAVLNALLIPPLGMYGSATATAIAYVLEAVLLVVLARRLFSVSI